jgi:hypothetical protein
VLGLEGYWRVGVVTRSHVFNGARDDWRRRAERLRVAAGFCAVDGPGGDYFVKVINGTLPADITLQVYVMPGPQLPHLPGPGTEG